MNIDEFIERAKEKAREYRCHADLFESDNPMNTVCIKSAEDCEQLAEWLEKAKEYQQLEGQGRLLKLPCKIGDTVWNYGCFGLRDYKVTYMGFDKDGLLYFDCESGITYSFRCYLKDFKDKIFLTKSEAEAKLEELRGGENGTME